MSEIREGDEGLVQKSIALIASADNVAATAQKYDPNLALQTGGLM